MNIAFYANNKTTIKLINNAVNLIDGSCMSNYFIFPPQNIRFSHWLQLIKILKKKIATAFFFWIRYRSGFS